MKILKHKNRNGFLIVDNDNNIILQYEIHNSQLYLSDISDENIIDFEPCDTIFGITQLNVLLSKVTGLITNF